MISSSRAGVAAGAELAELDDGRARRDRSGLDGVMEITPQQALAAAVADEKVGPREHPRLELVLVGRIRPHRRHVYACAQPLRPDDRLGGRRGRDDDVGRADRLLGVTDRLHLAAEDLGHLLGVSLGALVRAALDEHALEAADELEGLNL